MNKPHAVYRMTDATGKTLYIGCSSNPVTRMISHGKLTPWFGSVANVSFVWFETSEEAFEVERAAIEAERPEWNVHHNINVNPKRRRGVFDPLYRRDDPSAWVVPTKPRKQVVAS